MIWTWGALHGAPMFKAWPPAAQALNSVGLTADSDQYRTLRCVLVGSTDYKATDLQN